MIMGVQVGASVLASSILESAGPKFKEELNRKVGESINFFLTSSYQDDEHILKLCKNIASFFSDSMVASYIVDSYVLYVFIDALPEELTKKFLYIPQPKRMH